ncbi:ribosomal large subunit pseudouridine synthase D [Nautilia profundicola AmH]|uniref:Pseudouridine synthase n=1 Tax=Nautilia profundicola (strain ATCC BAA-1463 / DSM 18972 / AmH) TaxID=598659 RepID=B9L8H5_NAUPA|nr:RluA family pseudouridine synthase [Nautilia profundicola]ACM92548.1 ribosomal large subunit pseudouridine synthase D [Nautilia profundicola AmH]
MVKRFISDKNERVDKFLSQKLNVSRNQIEQLIKNSLVSVNSKTIKKGGVKLQAGDTVDVEIKEAESSKEDYEVNFDIPVLYEDEDVLVINKPPGIVVHPAPSVKEATLVDWLKTKNYRLSTIAGEERFGIVHRIDKETSGALIIAKNNKAHEFLSAQLKDKTMGRYYIMLLNEPLKEAVCVDKPIARNPKNRLKMAYVKNGREAKTLFVPVYENVAAAKLFTGRTHQIRVHLSTIGRYILGDTLYGKKEQKLPRVMLHAKELYFIHPSGKKLSIIAPMFDDFKKNLPKGFNYEETDTISDIFTSYHGLCGK